MKNSAFISSKPETNATKEEARSALVPRLRFPEFRGLTGWNADDLIEVAVFVNEKVNVAKVALENYVSTESILPDYAGIGGVSKLPAAGSVTRFKPNDTLVSNIRPYLKKVWVADKEGGASNDVIVIRAKQALLPEYLACLLKNDAFIDYVMTGAKGVKMPRGDIGSMKEYPTLYPSPAEQQKIAECLGSVDELLAAQARKVDTLKTYKKGLMQQLFPREGETQPRLRFPEFQNAADWEGHQLGAVCDLYQPVTLSSSQLSMTGEYLVYGANGVIGTHNEYNHEDSEIAVTCRGATCGEVTATKPTSWITGNAMVVKPRSKKLRKVFILHYFKNHGLKTVISGSAQPQITRTGFAPLVIFFPEPDEQQRIAECLNRLDALITAETQKLEALKTHKKGLMQQLFPAPETATA